MQGDTSELLTYTVTKLFWRSLILVRLQSPLS